MTAKTQALPPRLKADRDPHIEWLAERSDERLLLVWACAIAVIVHGLAFMIDLPEPRVVVPPPKAPGPTVYRTQLPPPPPPTPVSTPPAPTIRRTPIPLRELDMSNPVEEPAHPVIEDPAIQGEFDLPMAPPVAPPRPVGPTGPVPLTLEMTRPVLIEDSKVPPVYPEMPRQARLPGDVIVQAVIRRDGSVADVTVLRSTPPGIGFEEAAIEAVQQWRYEPATHLGEPVEVYFTVYVSFELR